MSGPFRPSELAEPGGAAGTAGEQADLLATARELEWLAATAAVRPSDAFTDRVWAAISAEPLPHPTGALGPAARRGGSAALLLALRDTWQVAWTGGRPLGARVPAIALVLLLVLAIGSVGGLAAAGAFGLLGPSSPTVAPPGSPARSFVGSGSVDRTAGPPAEQSGTGREPRPGAIGTPETETPKPKESPEPTRDREADRHAEAYRDTEVHSDAPPHRDARGDRDAGAVGR